MIDHDAQSYDDIAQAFVDGKPVDDLTRDEILDNITLYWLTNTGVSSARLYWENKLGFFNTKGRLRPGGRVDLPAGDLSSATELGRACLSQAHLLQRGGSRATTSPPGKSRNSSPKRSAPGSGRFARRPMSEGLHMPSLGGATEWLNSEPLGPAELRGHVVDRRLLDPDLHQLAAYGTLRPCLVADVPR